jgi:hypothetical protein
MATINAEEVNIIKEQPQYVARTKTRYNMRAKHAGELVAVRGKSFAGNIKANANRHLAKTLLLGAAGAILYPLVPTVLMAITKDDWNGYKGLITGVGTATLLGLATGKPEITVGACSAARTHLLYSKGTGAIENALNTQIFRMNPDSVFYEDDGNK